MFNKPSEELLGKIRAAETHDQRQLLACAYHLGLDPSRIDRVKLVIDGGGHYTGLDVVMHISTGRQTAKFVEVELATAVIDRKTHHHGCCARCNILWWWPKDQARRTDFRPSKPESGPRCFHCAASLLSTRRRIYFDGGKWVGATRKMILGTWS